MHRNNCTKIACLWETQPILKIDNQDRIKKSKALNISNKFQINFKYLNLTISKQPHMIWKTKFHSFHSSTVLKMLLTDCHSSSLSFKASLVILTSLVSFICCSAYTNGENESL